MPDRQRAFKLEMPNPIVILALLGLSLSSLYNNLLFHTLTEIFSIMVAFSVFTIVWAARRFPQESYLLLLGISYLFTGAIDVLHMLAYKGMAVFPGRDANFPTQFWIAAHFMQSVSFLALPLVIGKKLNINSLFFFYLAVSSLLVAAIFTGYFPDCFLEGTGLTPFKKACEYLICAILGLAIVLIVRKKDRFNPSTLHMLVLSIVLSIGSELCFTAYADVFALSNTMGHALKFGSCYVIFKAITQTSITDPYNTLFWDLKQSEERFRLTFEQSPVGVAIAGPGFRWVRVNETLCRMLGYSEQEMLALGAPDISHPDDLYPSLDYSEKLMSGEIGHFRLEKRYIRKDGEIVWGDVSVRSIRDNAGRFLYYLSIFIDITKRKRAEENLRRYEFLAGNSRDIILFMRRDDGRILEANHAAALAYGYAREELLQMRIHELRAPDSLQLTAEQMAEADERGILFETRHMRRDGTVFPVEVSSRGATIGEMRTLVSVVRNICERKQLEEEREKLIEQLQESLANVKTLSGLLPICAHCKKIRKDEGYWQQIETFIHENSDAQFSHGICPDCLRKHYPDFLVGREFK